VTTASDAVSHTGVSLRDAIALAQSTAEDDTIVFDASLSGATITLEQGQLLLDNVNAGVIKIDGSGLSTPIAISGNNTSRVFQIESGVQAVFDRVSIQDGRVSTLDTGGGIYNGGTLTVSNATFFGNFAGYGGGIFNTGTMKLSNATLTGNTAGRGGGIYNPGTLTISGAILSSNSAEIGGGIFNSGRLTVNATTFSGNSSQGQDGGGIHTDNSGQHGNADTPRGLLTVTNSTFSFNSASVYGGGINIGTASGRSVTIWNCTFYGNTAGNAGGGIYVGNNTGAPVGGRVRVSNSTISGNSAGTGGGIDAQASFIAPNESETILQSTIVAGNTSGNTNTPSPDVNGNILFASAHNLIGKGNGMTGISNKVAGNKVGTIANPINPRLSPLGSHGGFTQTMPLRSDSPAINAGGAITALGVNISETATAITVANGSAIASTPGEYLIKIDSEWMLVTNVSGNNLTVIRGYGGTTAASHAGNTPIFLVTDQRGGTRGKPDIGAFEFGAQVVDRFSVQAPKRTTTGIAVPIVVRAITTTGATATGFRGTVRFTSSDTLAGLPADYTFTAADRGQHTFMVTFETVGTTSLTATDTAQDWVNGVASLWVNTAPVLTSGAPNLPGVAVNDFDPRGVDVGKFAGPFISDVDMGAVEGIAVIRTGGASFGQWQYSINDGADWNDFGSASSRNARLLRFDDAVRFLPNPDYTVRTSADALPTLTYRAWDQTTGVAGETVKIGSTGGTSSFSIRTQTARVHVNDAPVLTPTAPDLGAISRGTKFTTTVAAILGSSVQDAGTGTRQGIAVTGLSTTGGFWQYSIDGGKTFKNFAEVSDSNALLLRATDRIRFVALDFTGDATLTFCAWDQTVGRRGQTVDLPDSGLWEARGAFSSATDVATLHLA
jgi:hypothetical protein